VAPEQRKLAAILAADVVGYSRLMGRDESSALARPLPGDNRTSPVQGVFLSF
jgi:class 3 adenylate cyclase